MECCTLCRCPQYLWVLLEASSRSAALRDTNSACNCSGAASLAYQQTGGCSGSTSSTLVPSRSCAPVETAATAAAAAGGLMVADIEELGAHLDEDARATRGLLEAHVKRVGKAAEPAQPQPADGPAQGRDASAAVPGTQRIWVRTFGCSHNSSDSEYMMGQLQEFGYK